MKATLAVYLLLCAISAIAAPTEDADAGEQIKQSNHTVVQGIQDGIENCMGQIDDQLSSECLRDDNCYFFQECEKLQCQLTTWAWIVLVVAAVLVVLGVISCVCCCVKKIFCCSN